MELRHPRLRSFSLARCRGARGVTLACPALESVSLVECEELDTAELSVAVRKLSLGEGGQQAGRQGGHLDTASSELRSGSCLWVREGEGSERGRAAQLWPS